MDVQRNGMKPVRVIAVDMDGTLLNPQGVIEQENVRALMDAQRAGIAVCINTGRMVEDAADYARRAGLQCAISGINGAHIVDNEGKTIYASCMPPEQSSALVELLLESGMYLNAFFDGFYVTVSPDGQWSYHLSKRELVPYGTGAQALRQAAPRGIRKVFVKGKENNDPALEALRAQVQERFPTLKITSSYADNIEIGPAGSGKDGALRTLCAHWHATLEEAMALGDEENDLPVLRVAGYSVAMDNAKPEVKRVCRFHTLDNAHAGVAYAVRRWALLEDGEEGN